MSRRVCIVETTAENAPILKNHLPPGVKFTGERDIFDRDGGLELRLDGDGLPEWCELPHAGASFIHAVAWLAEDDGTMWFALGSGIPDVQVPAKFKE